MRLYGVLAAALGEQVGDTRNTTQHYLKVLIILHEMLKFKEEQIVEVQRAAPGLRPAVERLRNFRAVGDANHARIQLLASEVERRAFPRSREAVGAGGPDMY